MSNPIIPESVLINFSRLSLARSLVLSSVWLTWWQGDHFHMGQGEYMGVYACLGVLQAIFTCALPFSF